MELEGPSYPPREVVKWDKLWELRTAPYARSLGNVFDTHENTAFNFCDNVTTGSYCLGNFHARVGNICCRVTCSLETRLCVAKRKNVVG